MLKATQEKLAMASSCEKVVEKNDDLINCSICLEHFRKPKQLMCSHTFCESCLDAYIQTPQNRKDDIKSFLCPVCRQDINSPDPNAPVKDWAGLLPTNDNILNAAGNPDSDITAASNDRLCAPCERGGETSTAKFYCFECCDSFCEVCKKFHERMIISSKHKVLSLKDIDLPYISLEVNEPCPIHKGEDLKVFCMDHKKMCCVLCLALNHRECKNIKTMDEMDDTLNSDVDVKNICEMLNTVSEKVETTHQKKQENIDLLGMKHKEMLDQVSAVVADVKTKLDKYLDDFRINSSHIHKSQVIKLSQQQDVLDEFKRTLDHSKRMLETVTKHGTARQLFVLIEKIKGQLESQMEQLNWNLKNEEIDYSLQIDSKRVSFTSVGTINSVISPTEHNILPELDALLTPILEFPYMGLKYEDMAKARLVKLWDVKDTTAWFTGGTFLQDGRIVFADIRNQMLKVYNSNGNVLICHKLDYQPWDVVLGKDNLILVSDYSNGSVRFYEFSESVFKFLHNIQVTTKGRLRGFDILHDYLVAANDKNIKVCNMNLKDTKTITISNCSNYIHATKNKFYFSKGNTIQCKTDIDTKAVTDVYSFKEGKEPRGIAVDNSGNIFVCGKQSRVLYLISPDGEKCSVLKSNFDGIFKPYAVGLDSDNKRIFVTSYKEQYDNTSLTVVEVYQLQV